MGTDLREMPGVGEKVAGYMREVGICCVEDLEGGSAEELYEKMCDYKASPVDRCMLYVLRCCVYYASNDEHDEELLKWWNWKDE